MYVGLAIYWIFLFLCTASTKDDTKHDEQIKQLGSNMAKAIKEVSLKIVLRLSDSILRHPLFPRSMAVSIHQRNPLISTSVLELLVTGKGEPCTSQY